MSEYRIKGGLGENILTALCYNEECAAQLMLLITPDMFDTPGLQLLATRAMDYIRTYNKPPRRHMRDIFEAELRYDSAQGLQFRNVFTAMEDIATNLNPQYILDQLETFIGAAQVRTIIAKAQESLNKLDIDGAKLALTAKEAQVSYSHGKWLHRPDEMLSFLNKNNDEEPYSSGIDALDERGVQPARQTLMVFIAPPKSGKSWYLINQGKKNLVQRKSVLHITCENSEELTARRYIQALYSMSKQQVKNVRLPFFNKETGGLHMKDLDDPILLDESQRIPLTARLRSMERRPRLLIKGFASGILTVPMIIAYLDMLERTEGFTPDLLIVDYPKQMKLDPRNYRLDLGRILIELRGIAGTRGDKGIAVSTVMQGSKVSKNARVVRATMTAEDYSVVGTADTVLTYSQTPEEKRIGYARILVDAARDAEDSYIVMISQYYPIGQFCVDSMYMTQHLEAEAERISGISEKEAPTTDEEDDEEASLM